MHRFPIRALVVTALLAATLAACSGDSSSSTGPSINPVGSWAGTTSQSLPFSFVVTSAGLTSVTMKYHLNGSRCSYDSDVSVSGPAVPVTNNSISISSMPLGPGTTLSATGNFSSSTASSGSFSISDTSCGGTTSGTWTATKH
jgi:hypothetical protein